MSRTDLRRRLWWVGAAAVVLRLGTALLTEIHPIFPAYYYTDGRIADQAAAAILAAKREGRPSTYNASLSQNLQARILAGLYGLTGPRPLAAKAANAVLGGTAAAILGAALLPVFGPSVATASAMLCAAWPSHVFHTSQNLKEAPTNLLVYVALWAGLSLLGATTPSARSSILLALSTAIALIMTGFFRSYVLMVAAASLCVAALISLYNDRRRQTLLCLAAALLALALFKPVSGLLLRRWTGNPESARQQHSANLLPITQSLDDPAVVHTPLSPAGLSEFRRLRQAADRYWALHNADREIGTQIFPEARFQSWLDVLTFLPKASFHVLFMPLPGLYPMDGKIGRVLAGAENLVLFALALLGALGALRGPRTPARAALLVLFAAMTAGSALLEFDLGSAGRHKLLYVPMLFPFAVEEARRLLGREESA